MNENILKYLERKKEKKGGGEGSSNNKIRRESGRSVSNYEESGVGGILHWALLNGKKD